MAPKGRTIDKLSGTKLAADPLILIGFERQDSKASLGMLAGNVVVQLAVN
jgi:hypothetical protein